MFKNVKNLLICFMVFIIVATSVAYASNVITDKKGRVVDETIKPTAESTVDPDKISDVSSSKYGSQIKNVISKNLIIDPLVESSVYQNQPFTKIRHTPSITIVDRDSIEIIKDVKADRIRMKIKESGVGVFEAKNGFYQLDGKVYYFDENGLMVLGPAKDNMGNEYFFSYDTGEMIRSEY